MGGLLSYSILSGMLMLSMLLAYKVLLAQENQHSYNRTVLLGIYIVSFGTMPLIHLLQRLLAPASSQVTTAIEDLKLAAVTSTSASGPLWSRIVLWVFMAGMLVVAIRTLWTWLRLIRVIRAGEKVRRDGYSLVLTDDERFAPFSWMQYIVISRDDYAEASSAIATHEMKHIASRHWIDLLIAQAVCIVNWFNPAAWIMRDELMLVHEYQADLAVLEGGHEPREYQMLLIKKAVGARFPSLANSLNHSKLKKRITMMYKEKSGAGRKMKALALVPMLALALGVTAVPSVRGAVSTISTSDLSVDKGSESAEDTQPISFKILVLPNRDGKTIVTLTSDDVGDHLSASGGVLTTGGKEYNSTSMQCTLIDGRANIEVSFPLIPDLKDAVMTLDVNNRPVQVSINSTSAQIVRPFYEPEVRPEYPGGDAAMLQAIMDKVKFPSPDREWKGGANGLTVVSFTVTPQGTMDNFHIVKSCGYEDLDAAAIEAIKEGLTERWTPGMMEGKPVAITYNLPVRFKQKAK